MSGTDSNGRTQQVGRIGSNQVELNTAEGVTSPVCTGNNKIYFLSARADTYLKVVLEGEAGSTTVATTGADVGFFLSRGIVYPLRLDKGEVIKVDSAGDLIINIPNKV